MKVLVAEDNKVMRELMRTFLAHFGEVQLAEDGEQALEKYRLALEDKRPFDLICLDIMMPNITGLEVLREIRQFESQEGREHINIFITTSLEDDEIKKLTLSTGSTEYMSKPITREALYEKLIEHKLVEGPHPEAKVSQIYGDAKDKGAKCQGS